MNVSIGMNLQSGAWGGGNQFGRALSQYLLDHGHRVSHDLSARDLDIILLAEPDARLKISAYDHRAILRYLLQKNKNAIVVHRINNTSEARDDNKKKFNKFRIYANQIADHTIFVSQWVKERYEEAGFAAKRPASVILNGSDSRLWSPGPAKKTPGKRFKLVTHHWSNHWNKGFDVYHKLDQLLAHPRWASRLTMTYIGRVPSDFHFVEVRHVQPLSGVELAEELRRHDAYITASRFESGGHHNLEAGLCGLPLLYLNSGAMAEYCQGFGIEYTVETLEEKLEEMLATWPDWVERMADFPHTADAMCQRYQDLFMELVANRDDVLARRRWFKRIPWMVSAMMKSGRPT
ncbi:MAG: glycosyltransferase family 4 protein [Magnetococcales bacterium]|nr:glycosyltransferase family 4 protein [Magnetococcales bacterium]